MFSNNNKRKEAFKLLGLNENATEQEIKKAYRRNALKYHPDKNNNDETASDMFKKIKEAYDTLLKKEPNIFSYEEQINIEVDDIFNMFNNMASENVFFFGPETFQKPSKKKLTFKVKININSEDSGLHIDEDSLEIIGESGSVKIDEDGFKAKSEEVNVVIDDSGIEITTDKNKN